MAQLLVLPIFAPADVAHITQLEWNAWRDDVDDYAVQQGNILGPLDPARALLVGNVPVEYTANPVAATQRLYAAMLTTQWMMNMDALLAAARADQAQQQAVAAAAQQPAAPAAPAPILPPAGLDNAQLYQLMMNHQADMAQQQQQQLQRHIKAALPSKYTGKMEEALPFLRNCENYFLLNPLNDTQKVTFTLQLIEGEALNWRTTMLGELENPIRPAWADHWITFKVNFSTRFADPHEAQKAIDKLMSGTLRQSTTARRFIDEVVDLCNKAGWNTEQQWMAMIRRGISTDVARGMAASYPANYY